MATRGRKPTPTAIKELEGNPGKRALNEREPKPQKKAPACPKWLEEEAKKEWVPDDGVILRATTVTFTEGESVYDVLERVCRDNGIQMEASWSGKYGSAYVEGIANLYEFDVGSGSGWMYKVNGWFPNYGCSRYQLQAGDDVQWLYTCDLGLDVGGSTVS